MAKYKTQIYFDYDSLDMNQPIAHFLKLINNFVLFKRMTNIDGAFFLINSEISQKLNQVDHFTILHQSIEEALRNNIKKRHRIVIIFSDPDKICEYRRLIPKKTTILLVTPMNFNLAKLDITVENVGFYPAEYILAEPDKAWWLLFDVPNFYMNLLLEFRTKWWTTTEEFLTKFKQNKPTMATTPEELIAKAKALKKRQTEAQTSSPKKSSFTTFGFNSISDDEVFTYAKNLVSQGKSPPQIRNGIISFLSNKLGDTVSSDVLYQKVEEFLVNYNSW
jgi:hypothetical protein